MDHVQPEPRTQPLRRGVLSPALVLGEDSGEMLHELSGVVDKNKLIGGEKGTLLKKTILLKYS